MLVDLYFFIKIGIYFCLLFYLGIVQGFETYSKDNFPTFHIVSL